MKISEKEGSITLEACISLFMFTFLMLFVAGLMVLYMAQAGMSHALLQTSESMSLDPYAIAQLNLTGAGVEASIGVYVSDLVTKLFGNNNSNPYFTTSQRWYRPENKSMIQSVAKKRFVGYLANGDESRAEDLLKKYNIVNGLSGLDFSESEVKNGDLYLVVKYKMEYEFNTFGIGQINVKQKAKVRLFGYK